MQANKREFEVEVDGKTQKFAVVRPTNKVQEEGNLIYGRAFKDAVEAGLLLRAKLEDALRAQNLWDDDKQARYEKLVQSLLDGEKKLAEGGIKRSEAREIAIRMREDRLDLQLMLADRNRADRNTAEAFADKRQFNFFVSACTVFPDTGKRYFATFEDYQNREDDPVKEKAQEELGSLLWGLDDDSSKKLPENKALAQMGMVDDELHLVDKQGRRVDVRGRLVDENGRLVNEQGELIDGKGNLLNEDGSYKVEFKGFLPDDDDDAAEAVTEPLAGEGGVEESQSDPATADAPPGVISVEDAATTAA